MIELIELHTQDQMWATVEHSGDICKIVIFNDVGNTALVIPQHVLPDLIKALRNGVE